MGSSVDQAVCMACWACYISWTSQSWHFTKVFTNDTYPNWNKLLVEMPFVYYQSRLCYSKNWCRFLEWLMVVLITHMVEKVMLRTTFFLEYSKIFDNANTTKPCSLALTKFHFLLLSNNLFKVWCLFQVKYHVLFHCT
jgi:hypothetical protein